MISPEILRRYPFFAGLTFNQIEALAKAADEIVVEQGDIIFEEGDSLTSFYLVLEGAVALVLTLPDQNVDQSIADQLTGEMETRDQTVSTVGTGDVFGWSGLVPPHEATAGAKAVIPCRLIEFDCQTLLKVFEEDCQFGYIMVIKMAQVIRERLRDMRIESLAFITT